MKKRTLLALPLTLAALYPLSLRCRRDHPAWETLSRFRYAHRGLHDSGAGIPENSLAAFRRAVDRGFGAELDVHLTADGRLAVIHDGSLLRTAGADLPVWQLTAAELEGYRLEGTDEPIPLLEEVLPLFAGRTPLIVELKVDGGNTDALCAATCALLDQYPDLDYCIESFHPQAVRWLAQHRPDICRGQLSQHFTGEEGTGLGPLADFAMTHLLSDFLTVPDFIAYDHTARTTPSLALARKLWQVREVSWTVRSPQALAQCEADGRLVIFEGFIPVPTEREREMQASAAVKP